MASRNRWIWHLWLSCNHPFQTKFPAAFQNYLERQSCSKFPATFEKPVALGKTALYHATFTTTMRLLGFGFHARSILCARSAQNVHRETKHSFSCVFTFFHAFFTFCSCLFHSCLSQRNKTRENCDGFLQRGVASLSTFGQDMGLLSVTLFSLRLGFLGSDLPSVLFCLIIVG